MILGEDPMKFKTSDRQSGMKTIYTRWATTLKIFSKNNKKKSIDNFEIIVRTSEKLNKSIQWNTLYIHIKIGWNIILSVAFKQSDTIMASITAVTKDHESFEDESHYICNNNQVHPNIIKLCAMPKACCYYLQPLLTKIAARFPLLRSNSQRNLLFSLYYMKAAFP